jgi:Cys-tRNA(Pro)/Cys-tRNA(Cys) deacylase
MGKNNVIRKLEAERIPYQRFDLPAEKLSALEAAAQLGVDPNQVFKTIVTLPEGRGKPVLAILPGPCSVDLKALAASLGEKKLSLPTQSAAEQITGMQSGGISPIALCGRGFRCIVDELATLFEHIHISGGERSLNIRLKTHDLLHLLNAILAPICR